MREQGPPDIGTQVQALRERMGLSIRGLAELCDLSPNTISLIERGATSPNVSTLHQLATALRVPITAFFAERRAEAQVIYSRPGERAFSGGPDALLESLGSGLEAQCLQVFLVTLDPGAGSGGEEIVHDGHELVYCLEGLAEYLIDGRAYRLERGESLLFNARLPHGWRNPGASEPAVFLLAFECPRGGEPAEAHVPRT
ncbi:MAG TPA: cupin domain-containing protein [Anaerolineae bacterium]|nr:cupin domain-containing protein [Anaerolineae bacterium]